MNTKVNKRKTNNRKKYKEEHIRNCIEGWYKRLFSKNIGSIMWTKRKVNSKTIDDYRRDCNTSEDPYKIFNNLNSSIQRYKQRVDSLIGQINEPLVWETIYLGDYINEESESLIYDAVNAPTVPVEALNKLNKNFKLQFEPVSDGVFNLKDQSSRSDNGVNFLTEDSTENRPIYSVEHKRDEFKDYGGFYEGSHDPKKFIEILRKVLKMN